MDELLTRVFEPERVNTLEIPIFPPRFKLYRYLCSSSWAEKLSGKIVPREVVILFSMFFQTQKLKLSRSIRRQDKHKVSAILSSRLVPSFFNANALSDIE